MTTIEKIEWIAYKTTWCKLSCTHDKEREWTVSWTNGGGAYGKTPDEALDMAIDYLKENPKYFLRKGKYYGL